MLLMQKQRTDVWYLAKWLDISHSHGASAAEEFKEGMPRKVTERLKPKMALCEEISAALKA